MKPCHDNEYTVYYQITIVDHYVMYYSKTLNVICSCARK